MIQKISKRLIGWFLLALIFISMTTMAVSAEPEKDFETKVTLLPGTEGIAYNLQVEVTNHGKDFEGYVRVITGDNYESKSAYDTIIALPQDATKQFVLQIPKNIVSSARAEMKVSMVDLDGDIVQTDTITGVFANSNAGMPVGILSDNYSGLTYLDMGGQSLYFVNDEYPLNLLELDEDNLLNMLDGLRFLVIDQFNVSSLSDECIQAIQDWTNDGGILIIGTGAYGNETLSGFDEDFVGAVCDMIVYAGSDDAQSFQYNTENFYEYIWQFWDPAQTDIASLSYNAMTYSESYWFYGIEKSQGMGSVSILYYALSDPYFSSVIDHEVIYQIFDTAASASSGLYNDLDSYGNYGDAERAFHWIDSCNTGINFTVLKILIVFYVILIGPIIYLILRAVRKREFYWLAVPLSAVLFVGLVYFAGRGFRIDNSTVYSVTVSEASGAGDTHTFISAYNAKFGEWSLKLKEGYRLAGPAFDSYYSGAGMEDYYYHIASSPEGIYFGAVQSSSFENSCFSAWKDNTTVGGYEYRNVEINSYQDASGAVANRTGKMLDFMGIYDNGYMFIYKDVPPDAIVDLSKKAPYYNLQMMDYVDEFIYNVVMDVYYDEKDEEATALSAMYIGLLDSFDKSDMIIGVTSDFEDVVDDNCKELSFGCFYTKMAEE